MSTVHHSRGAEERELVKQRMRERLNMSLSEYRELQRKHRSIFLIKHKVAPKVISALRYTGRALTADIKRKRMSRFFFDKWLQPPDHVVEKIRHLKKGY
jgi:hypothetical protein